MESSIHATLTEREMEVLRRFAERQSNREIAEALYLSVGTVKWYAQQIFNKLGVSNRREAVQQAAALGLLKLARRTMTMAAVSLSYGSHLPADLTSFVGRERELADVLQAVESSRLVTLTGPGGTGKTRLALQAARALRPQFPNGAHFVNLVPLTQADAVPREIAETLGLRDVGGRPVLAYLQEALAPQKLLLVLDNFEHLMDAAPVIPALLSAAPGLKILVTSREVLQIPGEQELMIPPLDAPDPGRELPLEALAAYDAVALFVQRAHAVRPDFALTAENAPAVAEICARLDALPLAIELAAARVKLFTPTAMLKRLEHPLAMLSEAGRDVDARHQTLERTIAWSVALLTEPERQMFTRLGVLRGTGSIEAIRAICTPQSPSPPIHTLNSLVNKSLVRLREGMDGEPRFTMLHTVHEYAARLLHDSGEEAELRQRHAEFFLSAAAHAEPQVLTGCQNYWLNRMDEEHHNLRMAFDWFIEREDVVSALRMVGAMGWFWVMRSHSLEGYQRTMRALKLPGEVPPELRAHALNLGAIRLAYKTRNQGQALGYAQEALQLARMVGNIGEEAWALGYLAMNLAHHRADPAASEESLREALAKFVQVSDWFGMAWANASLGIVASLQGRLEDAERYHERSLILYQQTGSPWGISVATQNLGMVALTQGDTSRALALFRQVLTSSVEGDHLERSADALFCLALVAQARGALERSAELFGAARHILDMTETRLSFPETVYADQIRESLIEQMGGAAFERAFERGRTYSLDEAVALAESDDG